MLCVRENYIHNLDPQPFFHSWRTVKLGATGDLRVIHS